MSLSFTPAGLRGRLPRPVRGERIVGLIDIGSSKIGCLIAAVGAQRDASGFEGLRCLGAGHVRSRGVKAGAITDLELAEDSVRRAIAQAERSAGIDLDRVTASISCGGLGSRLFSAHADIGQGGVGDADVARVLSAGRAYAERDGRTLVHLNRIGYRLDGNPCGPDPRGMAARRLTADMHAVTAEETALRNVAMLLQRCHLDTEALVAAPFAAGLAATTHDERKLGVAVVDMGAGTTKLSMFANGKLVFVDVIPVGGAHVTFDVARGLQTPLAQAERIKTLYGTMTGAQSDSHEVFSYPLADDVDGLDAQASKADVASLIAPRLRALLGEIGRRLDDSGLRGHAGERIVLTGGGSQLVGIGAYSADVLQRPVRIGAPPEIAGVPESMTWPAFSTLAGLAMVAAQGGSGSAGLVRHTDREVLNRGYFERVGQWLMGTG